jgi:hypothetical protein
LDEPIRPDAAHRLIGTILSNGTVRFSGHALIEMKKDGLTTVDCVNAIRGGVVEPAEFENGSWRYGFGRQRSTSSSRSDRRRLSS